MNDKLITDFLKEASIQGIPEIKKDLLMSEYTTFKIGGRADLAFFPQSTEDLVKATALAKNVGLPVYVVGKGSNLLVSDEGFRGLIIFTGALDKITFDGTCVYAQAGANLTALSRSVAERGLTGLEFACGIPGTVGGAVYMNAGAYGSEMKNVTVSSDYWSHTLGVGTLSGEELGFGYRESAYMKGDKIILGCKLSLSLGNPDEILATCRELLAKRREKQPLEYPSAGSSFKRYPGRFTGQMIEEAGLKGFSVGDAQVSTKHAGFIVNKGKATCRDVMELVEIIKEKIYDKEGVKIECEIRYLSPLGEVRL